MSAEDGKAVRAAQSGPRRCPHHAAWLLLVLTVHAAQASLASAGMGTRTAGDLGRPHEPNVRYVMKWRTLGLNADRPRPKPWPEPTPLRVHKYVGGKSVEVVDVARVWSGHPVGFALVTNGTEQYASYYDAGRRMIAASRKVGGTDEKTWAYHDLNCVTGWDSHNYITMALDRDGYLHISGNMHCSRLVYFRMTRPGDITSMRREPMTGQNEGRVTYPKFLHDNEGNLLFLYRDGGSGNGRRFVNVYSEKRRAAWGRHLDKPLLDGRPWSMNAYPSVPRKGPDGWFHMIWVWRDTPVASTCHDISYARSPNLEDWYSAAGKRLALPITPEHRETFVDPVPPHGGLINMGLGYAFDAQRRPVVTYHKYDRLPPEKGASQIFNARWENGHWNIVQASDWTWRWEFNRRGSIPCEVSAGPVRVSPGGALRQAYKSARHGRGTWKLDPETLKPIGGGRPPRRRR